MAVTLKPNSEIDSTVAARFGSNDCPDGKKSIDLAIGNRQPGSVVRARSVDTQEEGENRYARAMEAVVADGVEQAGLRDAPWVPVGAEAAVRGGTVSVAARPCRLLSLELPR